MLAAVLTLALALSKAAAYVHLDLILTTHHLPHPMGAPQCGGVSATFELAILIHFTLIGALWTLCPNPVFRSSSSPRVVDRYSVEWATPVSPDTQHAIPVGRPNPPMGPYAGNGDVTLLYSGNATSTGAGKRAHAALDWQQWLYLSKNDLWGSDSIDYYPHLSAGRVGILITPPGSDNTRPLNGSVHMFPGNASLAHTLTDHAGENTVTATTRVLENNVVVTTLMCTSKSGAACPATLLLSDTDNNHFGVEQTVGFAAAGSNLVWWRKENLHAALNPAYVGSCDPHLPLQSVERRFTIGAGGDLRMVNGSCLYISASPPQQPTIITSGACGASNEWKWTGDATAGDIVHTASAKCLSASLSLGACGATPFAQVPSGSSNASEVYVSAGSKGCLVVVPDNNNNTLGVALGVADAEGALVRGKTALVSTTTPHQGVTLSLSLKSGAEYTLIVGLQTLRDMGCAGIRPQWETCTTPSQDAATALVAALAPNAARATAVAVSDAFWRGYWGASSVDLDPVNASTVKGVVERWYYLAQYLLACVTRDGKVTPALMGFAVVEPVDWGDQFTLDYNLESTFWGAGSSNRLGFIHPVMAFSTDPGAVATARLRAQNPGTFNRESDWPGHVGSTVAGAVCMPNCSADAHMMGGFKGAEWPAAAMPLGDGRLAESDLQSRFSGGLLATNLIQYWEYSRNLTTLRDKIYPFVKDNAEFYLSYAEMGKDGKLMFPYSCAQEGCGCRDARFIKEGVPLPLPNSTMECKKPQSPFKDRCPTAGGWETHHWCVECMPDIATGSEDGYHNSHPDVAFAASSFRNAVRFAKILGVDSAMAAAWQKGLDSMPAYASSTFTFIEGAHGSEFNGGAGYFVEAEYGHHPGVTPVNKYHHPAGVALVQHGVCHQHVRCDVAHGRDRHSADRGHGLAGAGEADS